MNSSLVKTVGYGILGFFLGLAHIQPVSGGTFHCPAQSETLKIVAVGDSRAPYHPNKNRLLAAMKAEKPDIYLHLGDMVFESSPEEWQRFDRQEGKLAREDRPILPVLGNHDKRPHSLLADSLVPYYERFSTLDGVPWYEYRCGPLKLLVLSYLDSLQAGSEQRDWLEEKLQSEEGEFLLVAIHAPPLTAMPKYSLPDWEAFLSPLFQWARNHRGVDMILSGHVHSYERFEQENSTFIVSGGGGSSFYTLQRLPQDLYQGREPGLHYVRLFITPENLTLEMVAAGESFAKDGAMDILDKVVLPVRKKP